MRQITILCFTVILFMSISACSLNKKTPQEELTDKEYDISAQHVFSRNGYYIDKDNRLFYYEDTNNVILYDIEKIYGFGNGNNFAIDKEGDVWAWGENNVGSLGIGHLETQENPKKIDTLSDIVSILSCSPALEVEGSGPVYNLGTTNHTYFLSNNGDIAAAGMFFDKTKISEEEYREWIDNPQAEQMHKAFESSVPIKLNYEGTAIELFEVDTVQPLGMLMENKELVHGEVLDKTIKKQTLVQDCKNVYALSKFYIAITSEDHHYGWGEIYYSDKESGENHNEKLEQPSKIAGLENMVTCSEDYISMRDGSFWVRKAIGVAPMGKIINEVDEVVCIQGSFVMTAQGTLYRVSSSVRWGDWEEMHIAVSKILDTEHEFIFEISDITYDLDIADEFWKYGGYSQ